MEKNKMFLHESLECGKLLFEAIEIINELAENNIADIDNGYETDDDGDNILNDLFSEVEYRNLQDLVVRARSLKSDRFWENLTEKKK
jgi:hypothetical protein